MLPELAPVCYFGAGAFPSSISLVSRKDDRSTVETFPIIIHHYRNSYNFFHQYTWEETVSSASSILDRHLISHLENRGLQAEEARTLINPHYNVNACNTFIHNSYAEGSEFFPSAIHLYSEYARIDYLQAAEKLHDCKRWTIIDISYY